MHVNPLRVHSLEHVFNQLPVVLECRVVMNSMEQFIAVDGCGFGEILYHIHLDDMLIENALCSILSTRPIGVLKPCSTKPMAKFAEMSFVSFFPQEVTFLEIK